MPGINATNVMAVFLLLVGMFAAVRAAMSTRTGALEQEGRTQRPA